jgi:hypothetical protein
LVAPEAAAEFSARDSNSDVAIVMAVDASSSIDDHEFEFQLEGIASAFRSPGVLEAIRSGPLGKIDVALLPWAGSAAPSEASRWFRITNKSDSDRFAAHVETLRRRLGGATGVGDAIIGSLSLLGEVDGQASRLCIDLSGDGRQTAVPHSRRQPAAPSVARAIAENLHVTINALAIENEEKDLAQWYRRNVVTGDGFVMAVDRADAFGDAMRRKLIKEIRQPILAESPFAGSLQLIPLPE